MINKNLPRTSRGFNINPHIHGRLNNLKQPKDRKLRRIAHGQINIQLAT